MSPSSRILLSQESVSGREMGDRVLRNWQVSTRSNLSGSKRIVDRVNDELDARTLSSFRTIFVAACTSAVGKEIAPAPSLLCIQPRVAVKWRRMGNGSRST